MALVWHFVLQMWVHQVNFFTALCQGRHYRTCEECCSEINMMFWSIMLFVHGRQSGVRRSTRIACTILIVLKRWGLRHVFWCRSIAVVTLCYSLILLSRLHPHLLWRASRSAAPLAYGRFPVYAMQTTRMTLLSTTDTSNAKSFSNIAAIQSTTIGTQRHTFHKQ